MVLTNQQKAERALRRFLGKKYLLKVKEIKFIRSEGREFVFGVYFQEGFALPFNVTVYSHSCKVR